MTAGTLLFTCEGDPYAISQATTGFYYLELLQQWCTTMTSITMMHSLEKEYETADFRKEIGQAENNFPGVYTTSGIESPVLRFSKEILPCQCLAQHQMLGIQTTVSKVCP